MSLVTRASELRREVEREFNRLLGQAKNGRVGRDDANMDYTLKMGWCGLRGDVWMGLLHRPASNRLSKVTPRSTSPYQPARVCSITVTTASSSGPATLVELSITHVPPLAELSEIPLDQGVLDWEAAWIWFEVPLRHIRLMLGSMWQYVIPRAVFGRPRPGHGFIPLLGAPEVRIDFDDHAPVVEQVVLYHIAN